MKSSMALVSATQRSIRGIPFAPFRGHPVWEKRNR
ncbi:hypothetical protein OPIT5_11915 [Opitutaceae bacterium TAV5]|nr:hypothetical protein OPIT5_11915 [Opitutaceae bacterium TAV5]